MQKPEKYYALSLQDGKLHWNTDKWQTLICAAFNLSCDWSEFTGGGHNKSIIAISLCEDLMLNPCWDCKKCWVNTVIIPTVDRRRDSQHLSDTDTQNKITNSNLYIYP